MEDHHQTIKFNPAQRLASFKPYFFVSLQQKIDTLKQRGVDIIRLDMGSPDMPPADFIIDALAQSAKDPKNHGYTPSGGGSTFRRAVAVYYQRRFQINLDPQTEILGLNGSKEGLFNFGQALTNPSDINLMTDPGYPVYRASTLIAGGEIFSLPLLEENHFLPELDAIPQDTASRARILWLNYPNNPTGAVAPLDFLAHAVELAHRHHWIIAYDNPYADVCFDGYSAPSILQVPGARDVTVEFNSLSKTYNMAGWRLGMAVGNPELIKILQTYKSQVDSSHFAAVWSAAAAALTGDQEWILRRNLIYQQRRDLLVKALKGNGFTPLEPQAAIYVWAKLPDRFKDDEEFCSHLLMDTGVSITPGSIYGSYGKGFLRISLATPAERIDQAAQRLQQWLARQG